MGRMDGSGMMNFFFSNASKMDHYLVLEKRISND